MKKSHVLICLTVLFLQSCAVTNSTKLKGNKPLLGNKNFGESINDVNDQTFETISLNENKIEDQNIEISSELVNDIASSTNEIVISENKRTLFLDAGCDKITFINGNEEEVKIIEIGDDYLKYKRCDNLEGPTFNTAKSKVFMIAYSNGKREVIENKNENQNNEENNNQYNYQQKYNNSEPETNGLAIASFILGVLGFIPLAGLILGIIANDQITENPKRFKGKGFAAAGMVLSLIWIMLLLILFI
jgi:hypothetical protein